MAETIYLLLGSNIGDREHNLSAAVARLEAIEGLEIIACSGIYLSEAVDMAGENPSFLNQVVKAEYQYTPMELLRGLEKVETGLGRTDKGKKLSRTLDCDILLFGDLVAATDRLTLPHPRLLERPFALVPLLEIEPELVHPGTRKPIAGYLDAGDRQTVMLYKDYVAGNR